MKDLIKNTKKSGMFGYRAKRKLKLAGLALTLIVAIAGMCYMSGTLEGAVLGTVLASAPLIAFKLPEGVQFSENEQKAMSALAEWMAKNFDAYAKGQTSKEDLINDISKKLEASGFNQETLKSLQESLTKQGEVLENLKERTNSGGVNLGGLKEAFNKNWEGLQNALKTRTPGFKIKAINEHNPDMIITTDNIISTTTGAFLPESVVNDPNLHLKRIDRQYIHDIANVSYVDEVPETYTFEEEGDEEGSIAIVAENGLKPQVELKLIKNKVDADKAAGYIAVTEEVTKWRKRAWAAIQRLFRDKVYRDYENKLTANMIANASSYASTPLDGTVAEPTDFDAIIATILQGEMLNFQYDTLVINPADKWRLAMTTTANGMFVLPYIQQGGQFGLLGLRVITTNKVNAGTFLIGEGGTWYIEEESPSLRTGLMNDDMIHNRMTIVGEIFFLSYVPSNNAGAWIMGNFATIKEALQAA